MAPKRPPTNPDDSSAADSGLVTRRSTRLATAAAVTPPAEVPEPPKNKKTKTTTTSAAAAVAPPAEDPEPPKKKKAKTTTTTSAAEKSQPTAAVVGGSKKIIIEHCKQCNAFKTRAIQVKNGLEKGISGIEVLLNPEKPRRGCFEIREEGGEVFISLLDMKRPFPPLKKLDMDDVISEILEKIR